MAIVPVLPVAGQKSPHISRDVWNNFSRHFKALYVHFTISRGTLTKLCVTMVWKHWPSRWCMYHCDQWLQLFRSGYRMCLLCFEWIGVHLQNAPRVRMIGECRDKLMVENNSTAHLPLSAYACTML
jgi:hypothetical protein